MKKTLVILLAIVMVTFAVPVIAGGSGGGGGIGGGGGGGSRGGDTVNNGGDSYSSTYVAKRDFATGAHGVYTVSPPYVEAGETAGNVQLLKDILVVRNTYTLKQLLALNHKDDKYKIKVSAYNSLREELGYPERGTKNMDLDQEITIVLAVRVADGPNKGQLIVPDGKDIGFIRGHAEDTDSATISLMAGQCIEAMRHGADTYLIVGEGAVKVLEAMGWGIQIGSTAATINEKAGSAIGTVTGGGFGYGEAEGRYGFEPWLYGWAYETK